MKIPLASVLSLYCINHSNCFVATRDGRLILETSTNPTEENALWIATYDSLSWILLNPVSSICLIFNLKSKLIRKLEQNGSMTEDSLKVKVADHLLLQLSPTTSITAENKLCLELIDENDPARKASPVFFVHKEFDQIFRDINPDFFNNHPTTINTIADVVDNYYDYIVIGSSFCCLAFIHRTLQNNPKATILVLERGLKYLPKHHQHCDTSSSSAGGVEFRPWTITDETKKDGFLKDVHGQIPLLGGRSTYWSGWSPTPSSKELTGWPEDLKSALQETYFGLAQEFLGVVAANEINANENNSLIYHEFQSCLKKCLDSAGDIESVDQVLHAPLAMGNERSIKFSTPEMLLSMKNVTVIYDCTVEKILHDGEKATALQTNQGTILIRNDSKLILAMSTLPATTLVLNSFYHTEFPQLSNVGKRFTAHPVSSLIARIPRQSLLITDNAHDVELGAVYIAGMKDGAQYHLQLSGVAYTQCKDDSNIHKICKKYSANSIPRECIDISQDSIIVSCSTLGELDHKNKSNQFNLTDSSECLTTNGELNLSLNDQDKKLWDLMDNVTGQVMKKLSSSSDNDDLEYWHEIDRIWKKDSPPSEQMRKKFLVHDASTMWIGESKDMESPVTHDYHLRGVDNVYITGGALWPTGGSWNPVLTIVSMAMHLADTILK